MLAKIKCATPFVLATLLTACGGGGAVNSTPTPPSGNPAPTPAPTPSPTPGTSGANDDLTGVLKSENFRGDGVNASGRFHADGRPVESGAAASGSLSIAYDAATQSYTIRTAGRSATFVPADLVASGSPDFVSFEKIGATSEALTMTRPGTSGPLTYQYVSGGAWERATLSGGVLDFSYDPFTFGVPTPDAALRRTGTGTYSVGLVGARAMDAPYATAGNGTLQVDFGRGSLSSSGVLTSIDVSTGLIKSIGVFFGEADLLSTTNAFSGGFSMDDGKRFTGGWKGRFYGPGSQEVGAVWHLASSDGEVAAGYMLGRGDGSIAPFNSTLTDLSFSEGFAHRFSQLAYTDLGGGTSAAAPASIRSDSAFAVNPDSGQFTYVDGARSISTQFGPTSRVASESTSAVDVYRITDTDGLTYTLTLNKAGAGNPTIALTYASFGHWEKAQGTTTDRLDRWFAWGIRTNGFQIPTGTGHFDGIVRGTAARFNGGEVYSLSGTSRFDMNFSAGSFTGSINPIGTSLANGSTRDFGTFGLVDGVIDVDAGLNANIVDGSNAYLGFFEGALFGPQATELGGSFGFQTEPTNGTISPSSNGAILNGVVVARRP